MASAKDGKSVSRLRIMGQTADSLGRADALQSNVFAIRSVLQLAGGVRFLTIFSWAGAAATSAGLMRGRARHRAATDSQTTGVCGVGSKQPTTHRLVWSSMCPPELGVGRIGAGPAANGAVARRPIAARELLVP